MRETQAIIERARRISADIQQLDLAVDPALLQLKPGQSLLVRPYDQDGWDPYLREQWIPVDIQPGKVVVEMPTGHDYAPGDILSVLSPVGQPIPLRPRLQHLLLIADDAMPTPFILLARTLTGGGVAITMVLSGLATRPTPFILLARTLTGGGVAITMVLSGLATRYPLELLSPEVEILHGETDWTWPEQVETFQWADQVLILASSARREEAYHRLYDRITQLRHHDVPEHYVCGMFMQRLACGTGACGACEVPSRGKTRLACTAGPAMDLKRIIFR